MPTRVGFIGTVLLRNPLRRAFWTLRYHLQYAKTERRPRLPKAHLYRLRDHFVLLLPFGM